MRQTLGIRLMLTALLAVSPAVVAAQSAEGRLVRQVRHELIMLPYYTVFDNLTFRVEDNVVTLGGEVSRPTLRNQAARVVQRIEGVAKVVNDIEVLPLSSHDDRIRINVLRAIYTQPVLQRYALGAHPSIRIIVKNGNVSLEGVVASRMDRDIAYIQANGVSGVFAVTNNLQVATS